MVTDIILNAIKKIKTNVDKFEEKKQIDCVTFYPQTEQQRYELIAETAKIASSSQKIMNGTIYKLEKPIVTEYGELGYIMVRTFDFMKVGYLCNIDFKVKNYRQFKKNHSNEEGANFKKFPTYEFLQYKTDNIMFSFVNITTSAKYGLDPANV